MSNPTRVPDDITTHGPLAGESIPLFGGQPDAVGCHGCTDCCHLPAISVTDEEAERLLSLHASWLEPIEALRLSAHPDLEGWQTMHGPCVFRRENHPLAAGGCRIYADRPANCEIFTCSLRLELRRRAV